ncbi:MAG: hypothetical protein PHI95_08075, partial [Bacteroidales bacterium]|nr:hypothetical protein [Bacteroidales bacterium]
FWFRLICQIRYSIYSTHFVFPSLHILQEVFFQQIPSLVHYLSSTCPVINITLDTGGGIKRTL